MIERREDTGHILLPNCYPPSLLEVIRLKLGSSLEGINILLQYRLCWWEGGGWQSEVVGLVNLRLENRIPCLVQKSDRLTICLALVMHGVRLIEQNHVEWSEQFRHRYGHRKFDNASSKQLVPVLILILDTFLKSVFH